MWEKHQTLCICLAFHRKSGQIQKMMTDVALPSGCVYCWSWLNRGGGQPLAILGMQDRLFHVLLQQIT